MLYYVVVDGQRLGPFDKKTITGMRVKKVLSGSNEVYDEEGRGSTVADLLGQPSISTPSRLSAELTTKSVYPRFPVEFLKPPVRAYAGLAFRGEGEVRIQSDVLRMSGWVKQGFWKAPVQSRVKIPHWHLEQLDRNGRTVTVFAPPYNAQELSGSVSMKFATEDEAKDFSNQLRHIMPWLA